MEKDNVNKKGKRPKPLPSVATVVCHTFFIIIMIIVHVCLIRKNMLMLLSFSFLKK